MHAEIVESLEEYLSGTLKPAAQRDIEAHLKTCDDCRVEVESMREISLLFSELATANVVVPSPGFYGRVMQQVGGRKAVPAFASLFSLDLAFGRRLVFASLLTLAALGSYLVMRETDYPGPGLSPHVVMAQQESPEFDSGPADAAMLATLTTYEP